MGWADTSIQNNSFFRVAELTFWEELRYPDGAWSKAIVPDQDVSHVETLTWTQQQ